MVPSDDHRPGAGALPTLFVFADETGDDRFDERGTRYFGIAAIATELPVLTATAAHALLYELQSEGVSRRNDRDEPLCTLHATDDPPPVRRRVLAMIEQHAASFDATLAYIDKRKLNPSVRTKVGMYERVAGPIATYVTKRAGQRKYQRIVFAFDQVLNKREQAAFKAAVKPKLKALGIPYTLMFHQLGHEPNGQIADYIAWAWSRSMEKDDLSYLALMPSVQRKMQPFDLFRRGTTYYYDKE